MSPKAFRLLGDNFRWRVAIHEAAHWAFSEYLGIGAPRLVSIRPKGDSAGRFISLRPPLPEDFSLEGRRNRLLLIVAGSVAENIFSDTRTRISGSDVEEARQIERGHSLPIGVAQLVAKQLILGPLWVPIVTCAGELFLQHQLETSSAQFIWRIASPDEAPWADSESIEEAWTAAGGRPTLLAA